MVTKIYFMRRVAELIPFAPLQFALTLGADNFLIVTIFVSDMSALCLSVFLMCFGELLKLSGLELTFTRLLPMVEKLSANTQKSSMVA